MQNPEFSKYNEKFERIRFCLKMCSFVQLCIYPDNNLYDIHNDAICV